MNAQSPDAKNGSIGSTQTSSLAKGMQKMDTNSHRSFISHASGNSSAKNSSFHFLSKPMMQTTGLSLAQRVEEQKRIQIILEIKS